MSKEGSTRPPGRMQKRSALILLLIALSGNVPAQMPEDQNRSSQTGIWVIEPPGPADTPERAVADQFLARRIKARLESDPWVLSYQVAVTARLGVVTLSGKVETLLARERAAELTRTVSGWRTIQNQLQVVFAARPDAELRNEIVAHFDSTPALQNAQTTVKVRDGFVLLSGSVDSDYRRQLAKRVARGVPGVRGVENQLRVDYLAQRSDADMQTDVASRLQWDPWLENPQIAVQVINGTAQLSGVVPSQNAKDHAFQDAFVTGVKGVEVSNLKILDQTTSAVLNGGEGS